MSRETLLDNAIAKAKEAEDWQLVEWLRMARGGESAARWYSKKLREASRAERKLLDENAKLRELVRDMYKAFVHGNCYRWCEFKEPCNYISDGRCQWYDRMRELGVEVGADGGMVSGTYIQPTEEGPICPIPMASVTFEGQKLTFDEEDRARFAEIIERHFRKLGVEVDA